MKLLLSFTTIFLLGISAMQARQLTAEESLSRMHYAHAPQIKTMGRGRSLQLAYTSEHDGTKRFYVFNQSDDSGFYILGADDLIPAVLGYCDNGAFSADDMPDGLSAWLDIINAEIDISIATETPLYSSTKSASRDDIPFLVTSLWGQGSELLENPFYNDCPSYNGSKCLAGCTATAMAQLMYYWKYPQTGTGSHSYVTNSLHLSQSANFATQYDWENMKDAYGYSSHNGSAMVSYTAYTATEAEAVAKLMHDCGVATNMDYTPQGSSAYEFDMLYAMTHYFKYDLGMTLEDRIYYSDEEWVDMLYSELAAGRPLFFGAQNTSMRHAFIMDGYQSGYFHINWGWDGTYNGYYAVLGSDALRPVAESPLGPQEKDPLVYNQKVIIGLQPSVGTTEIPINFCIFGGYRITDVEGGGNVVTELEPGQGAYFSPLPNVTNCGCWNYSCDEVYVGVGAKFVDVQTGKAYYIRAYYDNGLYPFNIAGGYTSHDLSTRGLPEGTYRVYQAIFDRYGKWIDPKVPYGFDVPLLTIRSKANGIANMNSPAGRTKDITTKRLNRDGQIVIEKNGSSFNAGGFIMQ